MRGLIEETNEVRYTKVGRKYGRVKVKYDNDDCNWRKIK